MGVEKERKCLEWEQAADGLLLQVGEVQARSAALGIPEADPLTRAMEALRSFRVAVAEARTMPDTTL